MKRPMKMFGIAAGIATRKMRYARPAPSVRATSMYDAFVFEIPDIVSIVTGNHAARPINATAEYGDRKRTMASGIKAVAGMGPIIFMTGMPQYRAGSNQPMQMPVINPAVTPAAY